MHAFVRERFLQSGNKKQQEVGSWLSRLFADRLRADYEDRVAKPENAATLDLMMAREVIKTIRSL